MAIKHLHGSSASFFLWKTRSHDWNYVTTRRQDALSRKADKAYTKRKMALLVSRVSALLKEESDEPSMAKKCLSCDRAFNKLSFKELELVQQVQYYCAYFNYICFGARAVSPAGEAASSPLQAEIRASDAAVEATTRELGRHAEQNPPPTLPEARALRMNAHTTPRGPPRS